MTIICIHIKTAKTQKEKKTKRRFSKSRTHTKKYGSMEQKKTINSILKMYGGSRQSLWIIQPKAMEVFRKMIADKR